MNARAAEQLSYAEFFASLRAQVGEMHATWCTRRPCDGVCGTSEIVGGGRYRLSATLPLDATAPTLALTDLASGAEIDLTEMAQQISGLMGSWSSPVTLPPAEFRPRP